MSRTIRKFENPPRKTGKQGQSLKYRQKWDSQSGSALTGFWWQGNEIIDDPALVAQRIRENEDYYR